MNTSTTAARLARQLEALPSAADPDFPSRLGDVVSGVLGGAPTHDPMRADLESLVVDSELAPGVRFAAFYGLLTYVRRLKDLGEYGRLFDKFEHLFADEPMLLVLRSQRFLNDSNSPACRRRAVEYAELAYEHPDLKDHYGVIQQLAICIVTLEEHAKKLDRRQLLRAKALQERAEALRGSPYATYRATDARIASLLGDYDEAVEAIDEAIEIEPSTATNYSIRIMDHQLLKARILFRRDFDAVAASVAEATTLTEGMRSEFLTLLGLLAAVVAFVVTGVNVAKDEAFADASRLLVAVAGSTIMVFASFSLLFGRHDRYLKLLIGGVGFGLILFANFAWTHL